MITDKEIFKYGQQVLHSEAEAVTCANNLLGDSFTQAVRCILESTGRVCVTGMGKAGLIGRKIQATLASTGTRSYFMHPVEALHGDIGMVHAEDTVIALSRSGSTEIADILPSLRKIGCKIILITAKKDSASAELSDYILLISDKEACPLGLAPSSTTTAMLALGDALALTVMKFKGITEETYAFNHPGGALGRSLMLVEQIMRRGENCPCVKATDSIMACYEAMQVVPLRAGAVLVTDGSGKLNGIVTQGDLFRAVLSEKGTKETAVAGIMTSNPKKIEVGGKVVDAIDLMKRYSIDELPVVDDKGIAVGIVDVQDVISAGF